MAVSYSKFFSSLIIFLELKWQWINDGVISGMWIMYMARKRNLFQLVSHSYLKMLGWEKGIYNRSVIFFRGRGGQKCSPHSPSPKHFAAQSFRNLDAYQFFWKPFVLLFLTPYSYGPNRVSTYRFSKY